MRSLVSLKSISVNPQNEQKQRDSDNNQDQGYEVQRIHPALLSFFPATIYEDFLPKFR